MITIVQRPQKFSPASNPVIWQVSSDATSLVNFKVVVYDNETNAMINSLDIFPTPAYPTGSYINLSRMLCNIVAWEVNNDSYEFIVPIQKTIRSYNLEITERVVVAGSIVDGDEYADDEGVNYIFNAEIDRLRSHSFLSAKYVAGTSNVISFLTDKPNKVAVNDISAEQLYFMTDNPTSLNARVRFYDKTGLQIDLVNEPVPDMDESNMYRLNISPKSFKDSAGVDFAEVAYYIVDLVDDADEPRSTERIYLYEKVKCHLDYINLMWVNSLGGIDSYSFVAPQETINITKFQIKKSIYGINSDGLYSDKNNDTWNPSDVVLDTKAVSTLKINSQAISDAEAAWLQGLFTSKQAFVELTDLSLVPALVSNTSYVVPKMKYNRGQLQTISLDLTLSDGFISAGTQAYSSNRGNIQFISDQIYGLVTNIDGYDMEVSGRRLVHSI